MSKTDTNYVRDEVDAMFFSRPLNFPGSAFGSLNIFFDPQEIPPMVIEELGKHMASYIEKFFLASDSFFSTPVSDTKLN